MRHGTQRRLLALVVALTVLTTTACATHVGGTPGAFSRAAQQAASATTSAHLVVELADAGRVTPALLDTTLADSLADLRAAEVAIAGRQVRTDADARTQQRLLAAVTDARAAVVAARAWATGGRRTAAAPVADPLAAAADALRSLAAEGGPT